MQRVLDSKSVNDFTTAAMSNVIHNPSITTSQESFHSTAIYIYYMTCNDNRDRERPATTIEEHLTVWHSLSPLPILWQWYTLSMNVARTVIDYLTGGQVPLNLSADQLLFCFAEDFQWNFSEIHGAFFIFRRDAYQLSHILTLGWLALW